MRAMLVGAPGSGKGTLAKRLVRDFGFEHVSSGDVLRQQMADGTDVGIKAEAFVKVRIVRPLPPFSRIRTEGAKKTHALVPYPHSSERRISAR